MSSLTARASRKHSRLKQRRFSSACLHSTGCYVADSSCQALHNTQSNTAEQCNTRRAGCTVSLYIAYILQICAATVWEHLNQKWYCYCHCYYCFSIGVASDCSCCAAAAAAATVFAYSSNPTLSSIERKHTHGLHKGV
eukprot:15574-Heterococcus_DN1.PRE.3